MKYRYEKKCRCGKIVRGYKMCYWQDRLKLKFSCYSCGLVEEYVDAKHSDISKISEE